jgi:hypothetical protein
MKHPPATTAASDALCTIKTNPQVKNPKKKRIITDIHQNARISANIHPQTLILGSK